MEYCYLRVSQKLASYSLNRLIDQSCV